MATCHSRVLRISRIFVSLHPSDPPHPVSSAGAEASAVPNWPRPSLALASLPRPDAPLFWAGACFAGDLLLWHWSLMLTSIAVSTLEANLSPLVVTLIAWIAWRQRPSPKFLLAPAQMIGAVVVLVAIVMARAAASVPRVNSLRARQ